MGNAEERECLRRGSLCSWMRDIARRNSRAIRIASGRDRPSSAVWTSSQRPITITYNNPRQTCARNETIRYDSGVLESPRRAGSKVAAKRIDLSDGLSDYLARVQSESSASFRPATTESSYLLSVLRIMNNLRYRA